jgi:hypothetical protein
MKAWAFSYSGLNATSAPVSMDIGGKSPFGYGLTTLKWRILCVYRRFRSPFASPEPNACSRGAGLR